MFSELPAAPDLLRQVLEPLLEDFDYWFSRSRSLLETQTLDFMEPAAQASVLDRLTTAQQSVSVSRSLLNATDGQAGVEMSVLMEWHKLVAECWAISIKQRSKPQEG
jgi:hypothetical protein